MAVLLLLISASLDLNLYFYFTLFEKRNKLVNQPVCFYFICFQFSASFRFIYALICFYVTRTRSYVSSLRTAQLFNVYVTYHYVTHFLLRALSHSLSLWQREQSGKRAYNLDTAVCNFFRKLPWLLLLFLLLIVCSLLTFLHIKIFRFQVGQIFGDAYMCVCAGMYITVYICTSV